MEPADRLRRTLGCLLLAASLGACTHVPVAPPAADALFHDEWFRPVTIPDAAAITEPDEAMRRYAARHLSAVAQRREPRTELLQALGRHGDLRLTYDASRTRTAAETFHARSGNCLSLALMTAAFARQLGIGVTFREVRIEPEYERVAGLVLRTGHVNLLLSRRGFATLGRADDDLVVDFLPGVDLHGQRATPLSEETVLALFMNNRAAEALAADRLDEGYAWARAALRQDAGLAAAANTLAVIYMRRDQRGAAEAALRHALARDADNTAVLTNLAQLVRLDGRADEAQALEARLARLQPEPPFFFLEQGRAALESGDARRAAELFARELRRQPYQHEVHFWAAQAWWRLGDARRAAEHLRAAMDYSPTVARQQLYGAKLDQLRSQRLQ